MIQHLLFLLFLTSNASVIFAHINMTYPNNFKLPLWNETWIDRLRQNLLLNYDKFARPTQHYNTTTVSLYLSIMQAEIDTKKSILSINAWVYMNWKDEKMKWKPEDYGGVDSITVSVHEIWQPDLVLYNSAIYGSENYESRLCIISEKGLITWIAPTVLQSFCKLDFKLWPFESNVCRIDLVSWTHNGDEIDIKLRDVGYYMDYYTPGEWIIKNISTHQTKGTDTCCPYTINYPTVSYEIKLTRSSNLFYHVTVVACIPLTFLVLITFWMRPESETKLILITFAMLIDIFFLLYCGIKIPARPDSIPLIVKYFSGCLCQMAASIVISAFVIHISTSSYDLSLPQPLKKLLFGKCGKYLGLKSTINEFELRKFARLREQSNLQSTNLAISDLSINRLDNIDQQGINVQNNNVKRLEWTLLAMAIDRFFFILFCVIFVYLAISYIHVNDDLYAPNAYT